MQTAYNDSGQPISQTYPTGEVVTVGYGSTGWMTGLATTANSVTTTLASNLTYTGLAGATGHITAMNLDGSIYNYAATFDSGMRLTSASLTNSSTSSVLYQTQPAYDAVNTVTSVQTSVSGQTDTQQFCYDNLYRLTWAGTNGTPPCSGTSISAGTLTSAQYQQSNSYDVDGRLTSGPSGSNTFGSSTHPHAVTSSSNGYSAAYDAAGDMTCRALTSATTCAGTQTGQKLSYDPQGRLTSWQNQPSSPTQTANYLYDSSGNRVAMQTTVSGTTTLTAYIGNVEEVQTTGGTTQTTSYYTVAGKRVAAKVNSTFYYFGYDALGSLVAVLNASGTLVGAHLYGPYGSSRYNTGILPTSIGFTGQCGDSVTGLDYYIARYYDPAVGMFLSVDQQEGNGLGMDPYAYVSGNPETWTDPTGQLVSHCHDPNDCGSSSSGDTGSISGGGDGSECTGSCDGPIPHVQMGTHAWSVWVASSTPKPRPPAKPPKNASPNNSLTKAAGLSVGAINWVENLIQNNQRMKTDFRTNMWTLDHVEGGNKITNDKSGGVFTERWYIYMKDEEGELVSLSINYNPKASKGSDPWDMQHAHFSSKQPNPDKWGEKGSARAGDDFFDPGSDENPGDAADQSFFSQLFNAEADDPIGTDIGNAIAEDE